MTVDCPVLALSPPHRGTTNEFGHVSPTSGATRKPGPPLVCVLLNRRAVRGGCDNQPASRVWKIGWDAEPSHAKHEVQLHTPLRWTNKDEPIPDVLNWSCFSLMRRRAELMAWSDPMPRRRLRADPLCRLRHETGGWTPQYFCCSNTQGKSDSREDNPSTVPLPPVGATILPLPRD